MSSISVTKCQGTGNDFILLDARAAERFDYPSLARYLCDRHFGVGADGLLVVEDPPRRGHDVSLRIFNPDGSEAEMCGNGVRCLARFLFERSDAHPQRLSIATAAGTIRTRIVSATDPMQIEVGMGVPESVAFPSGAREQLVMVGEEEAVATSISMGNPHIVIFVQQQVDSVDLPVLAAEVASWHLFSSNPNVEVARTGEATVAMRVFERGVGETFACGTGACAVAASAMLRGRAQSPVKVKSPGGLVSVAWQGAPHEIMLSGDAQLVFETTLTVPETHRAAARA